MFSPGGFHRTRCAALHGARDPAADRRGGREGYRPDLAVLVGPEKTRDSGCKDLEPGEADAGKAGWRGLFELAGSSPWRLAHSIFKSASEASDGSPRLA